MADPLEKRLQELKKKQRICFSLRNRQVPTVSTTQAIPIWNACKWLSKSFLAGLASYAANLSA